MKIGTCKGCLWLRGITSIGAGYCAFRDTMVFETDPGCQGQWHNLICETWVSYGETGEPNDDAVGVFWNKPVFREYEKRYFDPVGGSDCKADVNLPELEVDPNSIIRALLPAIDIIKGTRKLLRVTVNVVDQ